MLQELAFKYLIFLIFVPFVKAKSNKYSLASSSSVKYADFSAYYENTSTMQCMALCDGHDSCESVNYNLDTERCELTPHLPKIQTPASAEANWRVYYKLDHKVSALKAWQKSTYTHNGVSLSASYAIDGNRDNNAHGLNLYCASTAVSESYWAMEFKYVAEVKYVIIYFQNAEDLNYRNRNLRLLVSTTEEDCKRNIGTDCATFDGPPASSSLPTTITCSQPVTGKFLKIIHDDYSYLCLCEVEVYS